MHKKRNFQLFIVTLKFSEFLHQGVLSIKRDYSTDSNQFRVDNCRAKKNVVLEN